MSKITYYTPEQIRKKGLDALNEALGPVDAARFIRLFDKGSGDYTAEKENMCADLAIDDIVADMQKRKLCQNF